MIKEMEIVIEITDKDITNLQIELAETLYRLTAGRLKKEKCESIAEIHIKKIDFNNPALTDKGINWYAQQIINAIDFSRI